MGKHLKNTKRICELCSKHFMVEAKEVRRGWGRFCSLRCANIWRATGRRNHRYLGGRAYPYVTLSEEIREEVLKRDNYQCTICGTNQKRLCIHHLVPVRLGGTDDLDNLTTVCDSCHIKLDNAVLFA